MARPIYSRLPNTTTYKDQTFTITAFEAGLPVNLESLCFFDWAQQLSTAKGKNMEHSTFLLEGRTNCGTAKAGLCCKKLPQPNWSCADTTSIRRQTSFGERWSSRCPRAGRLHPINGLPRSTLRAKLIPSGFQPAAEIYV